MVNSGNNGLHLYSVFFLSQEKWDDNDSKKKKILEQQSNQDNDSVRHPVVAWFMVTIPTVYSFKSVMQFVTLEKLEIGSVKQMIHTDKLNPQYYIFACLRYHKSLTWVWIPQRELLQPSGQFKNPSAATWRQMFDIHMQKKAAKKKKKNLSQSRDQVRLDVTFN